MNTKRLSITLVATIISGLASGYFITNGEQFGEFAVFDSPGVFFGLATSAIFYYLYKPGIVKSLVWILTSWLSWRAALSIYLSFSDQYTGFDNYELVRLLISGVVGAALLGLLHWALIEKSSVIKVVVVTLAGLLGALAMYFIFEGVSSEESHAFMMAFAVWQILVGVALVTQHSLLNRAAAKK